MNTTADGSLYLTLQDLIAWDRGIRTGAVLRPESWREIFTPVTLNSGRKHPYGFGFEVDRIAGHDVQRHCGAWQGFKTYIARYTRGRRHHGDRARQPRAGEPSPRGRSRGRQPDAVADHGGELDNQERAGRRR